MVGGLLNMIKAPMDITPGKYFGEWLPNLIEPMKDLIGSFAGDLSAAISLRITGDKGGEWSAIIDRGRVEIQEGLKPDALVTIVMSDTNFIEAVTGQIDDIMPQSSGEAVMEGSPEEMLAQAKEKMAELKTIEGALRIVIDDSERPYAVTVKFAGELKEEADCVITLDRKKANGIVKGKIDPQTAFMSGQVKIEGNSSLVMQLLAVTM